MKPIERAITAGNYLQHDVRGIYVALLEADGALTCKTSAGEITELRVGLTWYPVKEFEWIRLENDSGATVTAKFQAGMDRIVDNSTAVVVNTHPVTQATDPWVTAEKRHDTVSTFQATVTNAAQVSLTNGPVGAAVRRITVYNSSGAEMWLGPTGVNSTNGILLASYGERVFENVGWQIFGIAAGGTSCHVRVWIES